MALTGLKRIFGKIHIFSGVKFAHFTKQFEILGILMIRKSIKL
jgi:hypothetical protein